jgi:hypothetical protein
MAVGSDVRIEGDGAEIAVAEVMRSELAVVGGGSRLPSSAKGAERTLTTGRAIAVVVPVAGNALTIPSLLCSHRHTQLQTCEAGVLS